MSRDWCFTDFDTEKKLDFDKDKIKYICYGTERCGRTDREHWQGFVCLKKTCRIPKCKEWLGGRTRIHLESRRGSRHEARDYCFKDGGDKFEWGEFDGTTNEELFLKGSRWLLDNGYQGFYCRYYRAIKEMGNKGDKWRDVHVEWLWGCPGCGKTRQVMEMDSVYKLDFPYKWFDGYEGEQMLLIDDYQELAISRGQLLNLLDGYRQRLETKGGHTWALWNKVYITSNMNPKKLSDWCPAIARRCDNVTECG